MPTQVILVWAPPFVDPVLYWKEKLAVAGVRLHHPTQRNVRFTVADKSRIYSPPYQCTPPKFGGCGSVHIFKTHHLNLDETGSVIIGDELYEKIKVQLLAFGFILDSDVAKPPPILVGLGPSSGSDGSWGNIPIVHGDES